MWAPLDGLDSSYRITANLGRGFQHVGSLAPPATRALVEETVVRWAQQRGLAGEARIRCVRRAQGEAIAEQHWIVTVPQVAQPQPSAAGQPRDLGAVLALIDARFSRLEERRTSTVDNLVKLSPILIPLITAVGALFRPAIARALSPRAPSPAELAPILERALGAGRRIGRMEAERAIEEELARDDEEAAAAQAAAALTAPAPSWPTILAAVAPFVPDVLAGRPLNLQAILAALAPVLGVPLPTPTAPAPAPAARTRSRIHLRRREEEEEEELEEEEREEDEDPGDDGGAASAPQETRDYTGVVARMREREAAEAAAREGRREPIAAGG